MDFVEFSKRSSQPIYLLKQIFNRADFIRSNYKIQVLFSGNYCVPDLEFAATVTNKGNYKLHCSCAFFLRAHCICSHTVAVADEGGIWLVIWSALKKPQVRM